MHAAHGLADHQLEVAHAQMLGQQAILRHHHVVVIVFRKARAQAVRGPRRLAGAERIRNDDEIFGGIERLAGAEQLARKSLPQHGLARAARAVQHQHGLGGRRPQGPVVQPQFRQHLAGVKAEVLHHEIARLGLRRIGRLRAVRAQHEGEAEQDPSADCVEAHVHLPNEIAWLACVAGEYCHFSGQPGSHARAAGRRATIRPESRCRQLRTRPEILSAVHKTAFGPTSA